MSANSLDTLLRKLHRQLAAIHAIRILAVALVVAGLYWASALPQPTDKYATLLIVTAAMLAWILMVFRSVRMTREVETASILLSTGQLGDAEVWLRRAIERFSLSVQAKIVACQHLAALSVRRDAHQEVVTICRELLRHRIRRVRNVWVNTRLMLADSLLVLDRVPEAYEAIRPMYDSPLSLADRMRLLPIQLRYELAADHSASAVRALAEKVQIAELLDATRAALVHALLAEACRREAMTAQRDFLAERAGLYHDLDKLAERYAVIAPVAAALASSIRGDSHHQPPSE